MTADLHDVGLEPQMWWACSQPERPYDYEQVYDCRCHRCLIKAAADLAHMGDVPMFAADERPGHRSPNGSLAGIVAQGVRPS